MTEAERLLMVKNIDLCILVSLTFVRANIAKVGDDDDVDQLLKRVRGVADALRKFGDERG